MTEELFVLLSRFQCHGLVHKSPMKKKRIFVHIALCLISFLFMGSLVHTQCPSENDTPSSNTKVSRSVYHFEGSGDSDTCMFMISAPDEVCVRNTDQGWELDKFTVVGTLHGDVDVPSACIWGVGLKNEEVKESAREPVIVSRATNTFENYVVENATSETFPAKLNFRAGFLPDQSTTGCDGCDADFKKITVVTPSRVRSPKEPKSKDFTGKRNVASMLDPEGKKIITYDLSLMYTVVRPLCGDGLNVSIEKQDSREKNNEGWIRKNGIRANFETLRRDGIGEVPFLKSNATFDADPSDPDPNITNCPCSGEQKVVKETFDVSLDITGGISGTPSTLIREEDLGQVKLKEKSRCCPS